MIAAFATMLHMKGETVEEAARLAGVHFPDPLLALIFGGAIVGPSARSRPEDDSR